MKYVGLLSLFLCCAALGIYASQKIKRNLETVRSLISLMDVFSSQIRYQALPLEELFSTIAENKYFAQLNFLQKIIFQPNKPFRAEWLMAIQSDSNIPSKAKQILINLGNSLGTTDISGQLSTLELHQTELIALEKDLHEAYHKRGSLYRRLGFIGGLMLILLFV